MEAPQWRNAITAPEWDEEAIEQARAEANALLDLDPNDLTARLMLERARLAEQRLRGETPQATTLTAPAPSRRLQSQPSSGRSAAGARRREPLDFMRLIARLAHFYPGFSDDDLVHRIPFKRIIAYAREMQVMQREEQEAYRTAMQGARSSRGTGGRATLPDGRIVDADFAAQVAGGYIPRAQAYSGPTVPVASK
jgi:hypothetical protein